MTAAVFERTEKRRPDGRTVNDELQQQSTSTLTLGSVVLVILLVGQLTSTLAMAAVVAALYGVGMLRLLSVGRATLLQTASVGAIHLGLALVIAGTV